MYSTRAKLIRNINLGVKHMKEPVPACRGSSDSTYLGSRLAGVLNTPTSLVHSFHRPKRLNSFPGAVDSAQRIMLIVRLSESCNSASCFLPERGSLVFFKLTTLPLGFPRLCASPRGLLGFHQNAVSSKHLHSSGLVYQLENNPPPLWRSIISFKNRTPTGGYHKSHSREN